MTKVGFVSLGCSKNLVDTEVMLHKIAEAGYEITAEDIEADIIIVNTCGFIESAKQESIDNILELAELKKTGKLKAIIATGCLVERYREEVMEQMPEIDALIGVGSLSEITMNGIKQKRFHLIRHRLSRRRRLFLAGTATLLGCAHFP